MSPTTVENTAENQERESLYALHRELTAIVGAQYVVGAAAPAAAKRSDRGRKKRKNKPEKKAAAASQENFAIDGTTPSAVVSPGSEEEVAAILRMATANDYVVAPAGGMTRQSYGAAPARVDIMLRTDRMNRLLHYDAGDLTLGVGAGMTIAEVQKTLAANGQFLPLDPMQRERSTVGGVLATNSHGPLKAGFGGVRDYCIGVHFVTADGKIAKGGGRVVKNVAGYDLMKLMIGSYGTLGVITSANFKVFPRAAQTRTFACETASPGEAMALRDRIMASPLAPMCLEIASPRAQEYLSGPVAARDPDHYAPAAPVKNRSTWNILLRAGGSDAVLKRYRQELGEAVTREVEGDAEVNLWNWFCDFEASVAARHRNAMVMHVNVNVAGVRSALEAAESSAVEHNLLSAAIGRVGAGALVFAFMPLGVDPPSAMQFANVASAFRGRLAKEASATVAWCPREAKEHFDVWGTAPGDLALMRGVRAAMDAKKILNRGRFIV